MRRIRTTFLAMLAVLVILSPQASLAQFERPGDDDPAIVAQRQKVFDAPFDEKAAHSEKLLQLIGRRFGKDSPEYASELQLHAGNLGWVRKFAEAQQANAEAVRILEALPDGDMQSLAFARRALAKSMQLNGFAAEAVAPYADFIAVMTDVAYGCQRSQGMIYAGCSHDVKDLGDFLTGYGVLLRDLGRGEEAIAQFESTLARFEPRWAACGSDEWGFDCEDALEDRRHFLGDFADYLKGSGKIARARELRAENILPRLAELGECSEEACAADYWLLVDYRAYRAILGETDVAAMIALDRDWLAILAGQPPYARAETEAAELFDDDYREVIDDLAQDLAAKAAAAGEARLARTILEPLGKAGLVAGQIAEQDFAARLTAIEQRLSDGDFAEGETRADLELAKAALIGAERGTQSEEYGDAMKDAGYALRYQDRTDEAIMAFTQGYRAMLSARGAGSGSTWYALSPLVETLLRADRRAEALAVLQEFMADPETDAMDVYTDPVQAAALSQSFMDPYEELNRLKADYAELLLVTGGDPAQALAQARHAAIGVKAYRDALGFDRIDESRFRMAEEDPLARLIGEREYPQFHSLHADALWASGASDDAQTALLALQEATMGTTSKAVANAAAERLAARSGATGLLEERERIDAEIDTLEANQNALMSGPSDIRQEHRDMPIAQVAEELRTARRARGISDQEASERQRRYREIQDAIARKNFRRAEIDQAVAAAAPGYFELVRPQALALEEAQALVGPDDAFLIVVPTPFGTHSLLVSATGANWHRSPLTVSELNGHVRRLLWDVGASIDVSEEQSAAWASEGSGEFPFDRGTAHLLYRELVAPHAAMLRGKRHLFVAASGSLSSLPFAILVTQPPEGEDGDPDVLRATPWLGDAHAIVQLPSLQSLKLLRAVEGAGGNEGEMLLGFGDPVLGGSAVERGTGVGQRRTRASGLPIRQGFAAVSTGEKRLADPGALRKLSRLPGTRRELEAMSAVFGPDNSAIFLAEAATEAQFRKADLARASVISFATHGLVAGEVDGIVEPGLVFTPPEVVGDDNDGLLTASEVTGLSLGADWVILSACNTASGDGRDGAPGLSGLSRSFFFAGARSLLASHWPVKDAVAAIMTVRILELQQANPALSRAEALQAAMQEIREDDREDGFSTWAHPSAWAPFAYIGDIR